MVIPAYNEEQRLPGTLRRIVDYLGRQSYSWTVIVVDDGSTDGTARLAEEFGRQHANVSLIRNPHCGKAYAVRTGILATRGRYVFLCDADLAASIESLDKLLQPLQNGYQVAIASRQAVGARRHGEPWHRHLMGRVFNLLVRLVAVGGFQDTQCGFKGFEGRAAHDLFRRLRLYASPEALVKGPMVTGFDVEVLFLAQKAGYAIQEVPIEWHFVPGSKVSPARDSLRMLTDVLRVRLNDLRGLYG